MFDLANVKHAHSHRFRDTEELAHCFVVLAQAPMIGKSYRWHASVPGIRRVLLRATRYVYYVPRTDAVAVLAVWHSQRGQLPSLF